MICNLKHVMTSWYTVAQLRIYILPFDAVMLSNVDFNTPYGVLRQFSMKVKFHSCHYSFPMKSVYSCVIRGYRVYWVLVIGEKLTTQPDPDGRIFLINHSVAIMKDEMTVGHLPKDISYLAKYVMHRGKCRVLGKKNFPRCCTAVWRCHAHGYKFTLKGKIASPIIGCLKEKLRGLKKTWYSVVSSTSKQICPSQGKQCLERITKFCPPCV